jgi:tetratricopeptide (TPR) repeat protein
MSVTDQEAATQRPATGCQRRWRRKIAVLGMCAFVAAAGYGGFRWHQIQRGFPRARRLADVGKYSAARDQLKPYLWLHPSDSAACLLMAELLIKDDESSEPVLDRVQAALSWLERIRDDQAEGSVARLQEARLHLLFYMRASRAERLLQHCLQRNPESLDGNLLMWKLMVLTGRQPESGRFFWKAYERSPDENRGSLLRDWYFGEFDANTLCEPFDEAFNIPRVDPQRGTSREFRRYLRFRSAEPDEPRNGAALARYMLLKGDPRTALELLQKYSRGFEATDDPVVVQVLFETCVELGDFKRAARVFRRWPEPHSGYRYWRFRGVFEEEVLKNPEQAVRSFERALATDAGKLDWLSMTRLDHCLMRIGQTDRAASLRERTKRIRNILNSKQRARLQQALRRLNDPESLQPVIEFYRKLDRSREVAEWERHCRWLRGLGAGTRME